jgi:phage shock protein A
VQELTMSEPKKRSFLNAKNTIALSDWVRANHATLTTEKATQPEAASRAGRALGFNVSPANVSGIVHALGLPPFWPVGARPAGPGNAQELRELATRVEGLEATAKGHLEALAQADKRIAHLEDELSRLMLHIINNGSKNGLIQLQSSHVETVRRMRGD